MFSALPEMHGLEPTCPSFHSQEIRLGRSREWSREAGEDPGFLTISCCLLIFLSPTFWMSATAFSTAHSAPGFSAPTFLVCCFCASHSSICSFYVTSSLTITLHEVSGLTLPFSGWKLRFAQILHTVLGHGQGQLHSLT